MKENTQVLQHMLPYSILGALASGFLIVYIHPLVLVIGILGASLFFVIQTVRSLLMPKTHRTIVKHARYSRAFIGFISGSLQAAGFPGSQLRGDYLRTYLSELSVRALSSFMGMTNFLISGLLVLFYNRLWMSDMLFVVTAAFLIIPLQAYGKNFLERISDMHAKIIGISMSIVGIILLIEKYFLS